MGDTFAGETFLILAAEGRLVVGRERADALIASLERTLDVLHERQRLLEIWRRMPEKNVDDLPPDLADSVIHAVFDDQLSPGGLERAARELPKYVAALRMARRNS
jgi:hypothetical protein